MCLTSRKQPAAGSEKRNCPFLLCDMACRGLTSLQSGLGLGLFCQQQMPWAQQQTLEPSCFEVGRNDNREKKSCTHTSRFLWIRCRPHTVDLVLPQMDSRQTTHQHRGPVADPGESERFTADGKERSPGARDPTDMLPLPYPGFLPGPVSW